MPKAVRRRPNRIRPNETETEAGLDRHRIAQSPHFRRLAGVTQVLSETGEYQLFYSRLTHSLAVGRTARMIATRMLAVAPDVDLDPDIAEAAGLAHDLGHPPFGHVGEETLNRLMLEHRLDGFEGNAQTFRILTKLATLPGEDEPGLNLTLGTLNGVLKYPWLRSESEGRTRKWNAYVSERTDFNFARAEAEDLQPSLEAQVMDIADDITYSLHDFTDFVRAGLLDLRSFGSPRAMNAMITRVSRATLRTAEKEANTVHDSASQLAALISSSDAYENTREDRKTLGLIEAGLTEAFIDSLSVEHGKLVVPEGIRAEIELLKAATWTHVIERPELALTQEGHRRTIENLFRALLEWVERAANARVLPRLLTELLEVAEVDRETLPENLVQVRVVADYISSLTDREAVHVLERLTGQRFHPLGSGVR